MTNGKPNDRPKMDPHLARAMRGYFADESLREHETSGGCPEMIPGAMPIDRKSNPGFSRPLCPCGWVGEYLPDPVDKESFENGFSAMIKAYKAHETMKEGDE